MWFIRTARGKEKTIASGLGQIDTQCSSFIMWKMEQETYVTNCSPNVLTRKNILFPFIAYKNVEIVIFIPAADHSEKQERSNVAAIFSILE